MTAARPRAFTLVELLVVIVIIGILSALVVPSFSQATTDARTAATASVAAGTRASIAAYRTRAVLLGNAPYPTLAQLTTQGVVLSQPLPANPFTGVAGVRAVTLADAQARAVASSATFGWNYYVDNLSDPPIAIFYPNSAAPTTAADPAGGVLGANEL